MKLQSISKFQILITIVILAVVGILIYMALQPCNEKSAKRAKAKFKKFSIGERQIAKKIQGDYREIQETLKQEKKQGDSRLSDIIGAYFNQRVLYPLEKYEVRVMPFKRNASGWIEPPKGVQPGTLESPPIQEDYDFPAMYDYRYGYRYNGPQAIERMKAVKETQAEHLILEERGQSDLALTTSEVGSSVAKFKGTEEEWDSLKKEVKKAMGNIADTFDEMFMTELFPGAKFRYEADGKTFKILSADGRCVMLERYYAYIQASIETQMGQPPTPNLQWLEGSGVQLGFNNIEQSQGALIEGLLMDCNSSPGYVMTNTDKIKSLEDDTIIQYQIVWPKDNTVLMTHAMKLDL